MMTNWSEYNQSLVNRGRIDIWINEGLLDILNHNDRTYGGTDSSPHYTGEAITICHEIRMI
ncbi:hypothetical protein [Vibrio sp. McD22-P3]|uniref:hypothetical protein n=1 Tax=Vibrio sp. McD22-P3 TaxID=2724880 RepID=UPI001F2B74CC|nr:hypothetical protein [Vibrio sp. McD22-P3]MCF4176129.1 hypothetical protein [Vibrio sp. McD22-P3]